MKIVYNDGKYYIEDHKLKRSLTREISYLKKVMVKDVFYPVLMDNKNEVANLFSKIKLLKILDDKIIVELKYFENELLKHKFEFATQEVGLAVNVIGSDSELYAIGITPIPSELGW